MQLITEKPLWFIIFCLILGAAYSWFLYRKSSFAADEGKRNWLLWLMSAFRFISVTMLAFLLLSPLVKSLSRNVVKPVIVIAQDNSESVVVNKDSSYYKSNYRNDIKTLTNALSKDYEVRYYTFGGSMGENANLDFSQKQSNISNVFEEVYNKFDNQNLGAVILATDGIYNQGSNPLYIAQKLKAPVFTIALGDTTVQKDVLVKKVRHNKIAYLGNNFPVEMEVAANGYPRKNSTLAITHNKQTIFTQNILFDRNRFSLSVPVSLEAKEKGMQRYTITISTQIGEISYANNVKDVFIDVLDGRQKILLLANAPHPDLATLKNAVESNQNYEVVVNIASDVSNETLNKLKEYDLIILHQLPGLDYSTKTLFEKLDELRVPRLYILGSATNLAVFNSLNAGLQINNNRGNSNDALAVLNKNYSLFTLSETSAEFLKKLPPLQSPFGTYKTAVDAVPFLYQQIGYTTTEMPLIMFSTGGDAKSGIITGEGLWRWRLQEYQLNQNQNTTNEILTKTIQYLSAKDDKRLLRITSDKKTFDENENVIFDAEVYNQSYEIITTPDVFMKIRSEEGKDFDYIFSKNERSYHLDAGIFAVGNYSYTAEATVGSKKETITGRFSVLPLQAELLETVADHQLLYNLAKQNNGEMVYPAGMQTLLSKIKTREDIKPVSYSQTKLQDLINLKWVFFFLLTLVTAEWFLRKREGSY